MATWIEDPVGSGYMELAEGDDVCPGEWQRSFDRADITTQVIIRRSVPVDVVEPAPIVLPTNMTVDRTMYGTEPYERNDLWTASDSDAQFIAGQILATRNPAASMPRIRAVTINAEHADSDTTNRAVDLLSTLSIFQPSRYRGRLLTDRGLVFDDTFFAVGVKQTITAEAWTAEISLDRAYPFEVVAAVDRVWDVAIWDHSLWN